MDITTVCNLALSEIGQRTAISSLSENSPAANCANLYYLPKTRALLRAAQWNFARSQAQLTLYKAAIVNGAVSANPPPQPFQYEYLYPSQALEIRFIVPYITPAAAGTPLTTDPSIGALPTSLPTGIPFVVAMDTDTNGNPIKVIFTNLPQAQAVYTADLSQFPDMWDSMFLSAETAMLAAYFINTLARNQAQMNAQIQIARNLLDSARAENGNEGISSVDREASWMTVRDTSGGALLINSANGIYIAGWQPMEFPGGLSY